MKKIKLWLLRILWDTFFKHWKYSFEYLTPGGDVLIVFRSKDTLLNFPRIFRIKPEERNDRTYHINPGLYNDRFYKIDAGWTFRQVRLKSSREVILQVCAQEHRLQYLNDFKFLREDLQKHPEKFREIPFQMENVMDLHIRAVGDGKGLTKEEREELVEFIRNNLKA